MPKSVNRPRDDADTEQMQQGQADFAETNDGEQMGEAESASSEPQSPA